MGYILEQIDECRRLFSILVHPGPPLISYEDLNIRPGQRPTFDMIFHQSNLLSLDHPARHRESLALGEWYMPHLSVRFERWLCDVGIHTHDQDIFEAVLNGGLSNCLELLANVLNDVIRNIRANAGAINHSINRFASAWVAEYHWPTDWFSGLHDLEKRIVMSGSQIHSVLVLLDCMIDDICTYDAAGCESENSMYEFWGRPRLT